MLSYIIIKISQRSYEWHELIYFFFNVKKINLKQYKRFKKEIKSQT
jgi:hypothetical protein